MHVKRLRMTRDREKREKQTELSTRPKRDVYKPIEY